MDVRDIFTAAAAVLASLGGAGVIILGLSNWLGKVWADRLMQSERRRHAEALEHLRSELRREAEKEIEHLRHSHESEIDVLIRRREVYQRMAMSLRVFQATIARTGDKKKREQEKRRFLAAYDASYLWGSDEVIVALGAFIDLQMRIRPIRIFGINRRCKRYTRTA